MTASVHPARRLWQLIEPIHAVTYFAPESEAAFQAAGLRGFWRGYFAGRAAPLGAVGPEPVTAVFFGFHPDFVARALPAVWGMVAPDAAVDARLDGATRALCRIFPDAEERAALAEAASLLHDAITAVGASGLPLFAANAALPWPAEPLPRMWHAATLLREHRGDGHVQALTAAGFDPCESHITQVAAARTSLDRIKPYRGWAEADWRAARRRLRARGLLDSRGRLTALGRQTRAAVEAGTDRAASEVLERLGEPGHARLIELLTPLAGRLGQSGLIPYPNPMGVPRP
jgi:hypothetical protein